MAAAAVDKSVVGKRAEAGCNRPVDRLTVGAAAGDTVAANVPVADELVAADRLAADKPVADNLAVRTERAAVDSRGRVPPGIVDKPAVPNRLVDSLESAVRPGSAARSPGDTLGKVGRDAAEIVGDQAASSTLFPRIRLLNVTLRRHLLGQCGSHAPGFAGVICVATATGT